MKRGFSEERNIDDVRIPDRWRDAFDGVASESTDLASSEDRF